MGGEDDSDNVPRCLTEYCTTPVFERGHYCDTCYEAFTSGYERGREHAKRLEQDEGVRGRQEIREKLAEVECRSMNLHDQDLGRKLALEWVLGVREDL